MLEKFTQLGYFLGWSMRNMGGLAIDLPIAFWRRVCKGSQNYVYTIEDLHEFDIFRAEMLRQLRKDAAEKTQDSEFEALYESFTFEVSFNDSEIVELCQGGASI